MHQAAILHKWAEIYSAIFLPAKRLGESSLGQNMPKYKGIREIKWCFDIVYRKLSLQRVPLLVIQYFYSKEFWKQNWNHWERAVKGVRRSAWFTLRNQFVLSYSKWQEKESCWRFEKLNKIWLVISLLEFSWEKKYMLYSILSLTMCPPEQVDIQAGRKRRVMKIYDVFESGRERR